MREIIDQFSLMVNFKLTILKQLTKRLFSKCYSLFGCSNWMCIQKCNNNFDDQMCHSIMTKVNQEAKSLKVYG